MFKRILIILIIVGFFGFIVNGIGMDVCYAEDFDLKKKTYEELEREIKIYKNLHVVEAGFRTIDIIFGGNSVFSSVGLFCDNIINVLDYYYLGTPLKGSVVIGIALFVGVFLGKLVGVKELTEIAINNIEVYPLESYPLVINDKAEFAKVLGGTVFGIEELKK